LSFQSLLRCYPLLTLMKISSVPQTCTLFCLGAVSLLRTLSYRLLLPASSCADLRTFRQLAYSKVYLPTSKVKRINPELNVILTRNRKPETRNSYSIANPCFIFFATGLSLRMAGFHGGICSRTVISSSSKAWLTPFTTLKLVGTPSASIMNSTVT
jgi:hypothetical protein